MIREIPPPFLLEKNIPSISYYASIDFWILRFSKTTFFDIFSFITPSNCFLKGRQKQGSKSRSIICMFNKFFGKHFTFLWFHFIFQTHLQISSNFLHCLKLHLYIFTFVYCIVWSSSFCYFFVYLNVWLFLIVCVITMLLLLLCQISFFLFNFTDLCC